MKMVHVTIRTKCMEESIKFYEEVVGLKIQRDLRPMGGAIVFMAENEGETQVELIENPEEAYSGAGLSIGFACEDVEGKRETLIEKGFEVTPIISPNPRTKFFFVNDPNGVQVQFI